MMSMIFSLPPSWREQGYRLTLKGPLKGTASLWAGVQVLLHIAQANFYAPPAHLAVHITSECKLSIPQLEFRKSIGSWASWNGLQVDCRYNWTSFIHCFCY